jgi:hypothetical protein
MMVERYPNLKEEVGSLIPGCEISSLLDKKNLPGGQLPPVLWYWLVALLSLKINKYLFKVLCYCSRKDSK